MITAFAPNRSNGRVRLSQINAAAAIFLLIAGGMVTSTNSGMAVPDWPLSYGQWLPAMTGGVFYEHGHRMIASLVGLLILIMAVWTQFDEKRPAVRRLGWWTLFFVCLQGVLGGVTVFFNLPVAVSAAHATLGQSVFCLLIVMAEVMRNPEPRETSLKTSRYLQFLGLASVMTLWCQLVMGAILRHGGSGISWHLIGALFAASATGLFAATALTRKEDSLHRPAAALLALLSIQLMLGLATADFRTVASPRTHLPMIVTATSHLAFGALLLGLAVLLTFRIFRMEAH
jgi:cytochrome c oxidase assembly protein subunit 15